VVAEDFEGHECAVLAETLGEERQTQILNVIVCHVQVDQRAIDGERLGDGFRTVVCALVVGQVKGFKRAVLALEILCNRLTRAERDFIGVQVEDTQSVILKQVLHHDVDAVVAQLVFL